MKKPMFRGLIAIALSCLLSLTGNVALAADVGGTVKGTVKADSGQPVAGARIIVTHKQKGVSRSTEASDSGEYSLYNLPTGEYEVLISAEGYASVKQEAVSVAIGDAVVLETTMQASSAPDEILVVGTVVKGIDMAETTTGMTFDDAQLSIMPVDNGFESMVLLTPGTVNNAAEDFNGANSIGGASSAENGYYLNGINITQIESGLGSFRLPWEAIQQTDVQTSGITAQFGGALGGVINAVSKTGSNEFKFGVEYRLDPESGYTYPSSVPSLTAPGEFLAAEDTNTVPNFEESSDKFTETSVWASGPLVKDKVFFYALFNPNKTNWTVADNSQYFVRERTSDRWFANLEWYVADGHSVGVTAFDTSRELTGQNYRYTVAAPGAGTVGTQSGTTGFDDGGSFTGITYHGELTNALSLDVVYGVTSETETLVPSTRSPLVQFCNPGCSNYSNHTSTSFIPKDFEREQFRFDLTLDLDNHSLKFGIDTYDTDVYLNERQNGTFQNGNINGVEDTASLGSWLYGVSGAASGVGSTAVGDGVTAGLPFVRRRVRNSYTDSTVSSDAYYVQDTWQVSDTWTLDLGVRSSNFENTISSGELYVDQTNNIEPRLGASWDIGGDGTRKFSVYLGRYFQPVAARMNYRQGASQIEYFDYYAVTDVDGQGRPALTGPDNSPAHGAPLVDRVYRQRGVTDPKLIASANLKAMYSDQFTMGYSQQVMETLTAGVRVIYNKLGRSVEDTDYGPVLARKLREMGLLGPTQPLSDLQPGQDSFYILANPGDSVTITYDFDNLDGDAFDANGDLSPTGGATGAETVTLTPGDTQLPKAERKYIAWQFTLGGELTEDFSFDASYTWAHSYGNTEGLVKTSNNQADPGWTSDYDYGDALDYAYGNLPNDRRHSLKFSGIYELTDNWILGAVINSTTGAPRNTLTPHPLGVDSCEIGKPWADCVSRDYIGGFYDENGNPAPRGTKGTLPTVTQLDMSIAYRDLEILGGMTLKATVYNLLAADKATDVNEWQTSADYGLTEGYQDIRSVSLTARLEF